MSSKYKNLWLITIALITLLQTTCKKIDLPDAKLEQLFGTWRLVESSGGFGGQGINFNYVRDIEFTKSGCYKMFKNGKLKEKMRFTLSRDESTNNAGDEFNLKYKNFNFWKNSRLEIMQSVDFGVRDTLFLNEKCFDCFNYVYVKLK